MLLIDPQKHPSFDPTRIKHRIPEKLPDSRFGPHSGTRRIKHNCDGCSTPWYITLNNQCLPQGAYMVRQHRRTKTTLPLPPRRTRCRRWNASKWAATWRCKDCLVRIYDVSLEQAEAILRKHTKALLPRIPGLRGGTQGDDSATDDTDEDVEMEQEDEDGADEEQRAGAGGNGTEESEEGLAPAIASREDQLQTWIRQYQKEDGYTENLDALRALLQLLEDTGGREQDLEETERILGASLDAVLGPLDEENDSRSGTQSSSDLGSEDGESEEESLSQSDSESEDGDAQDRVDLHGVDPPSILQTPCFRSATTARGSNARHMTVHNGANTCWLNFPLGRSSALP